MGVFVKVYDAITFMTGFRCVAADVTRIFTAFREGMFLVANTTTAISTTGPVIKAVMHPVLV